MSSAVTSSQQTHYLRWDHLPAAWGPPVLRAMFKQDAADFRVDEDLGFEPDGEGEHLFLQVEKTGLTTTAVQAMLANHYSLPVRDVSFAGMKDKQGITRQWFSLHMAGKDKRVPEPLQHPQLRVLQSGRNSRKLRRGTHQGNRFQILLRQPDGDQDVCAKRLQLIAAEGVPNYFGLQRFGRDENNLPAALKWFESNQTPGRLERGILLSAARSYLFNVLLSTRVGQQNWNSWIAGDVMALAGSASTFASGRATAEELQQRLKVFDIHATGPLWGQGPLPVTDAALALENELALQYPALSSGLQNHGLIQERRPLRLQVNNLQSTWCSDGLLLAFSLPRGTYATAVLRELLVPEKR